MFQTIIQTLKDKRQARYIKARRLEREARAKTQQAQKKLDESYQVWNNQFIRFERSGNRV